MSDEMNLSDSGPENSRSVTAAIAETPWNLVIGSTSKEEQHIQGVISIANKRRITQKKDEVEKHLREFIRVDIVTHPNAAGNEGMFSILHWTMDLPDGVNKHEVVLRNLFEGPELEIALSRLQGQRDYVTVAVIKNVGMVEDGEQLNKSRKERARFLNVSLPAMKRFRMIPNLRKWIFVRRHAAKH